MKAEETKKPKRAAKADGVPAKRGRPTKLIPEMEDHILERLEQGESLAAICRDLDIATHVVFRRIAECDNFRHKYAMSREAQAEKYADEIVSIADEAEVTSVVTPDGEVDFKLDATAVARNRLRVDARKWVASKLLPKKYGDKVMQELTGADGGPIDMSLKVSFVKPRGD